MIHERKDVLFFVLIYIDIYSPPPVIKEIRAMGKFEMMDLRVDEAEHSMEMHLPYLAKVFQG